MLISRLAETTKSIRLHWVAKKANPSRAWLREATIPLFAAVGLGVAGLYLLPDVVRGYPQLFAPQNLLEAFARQTFQSEASDCVRSARHRCTTAQEEPESVYAPFEDAARKVMRHAGL